MRGISSIQDRVKSLRGVVFASSMTLLPFSEWRLIEYHFHGPRSFSIFHIIFLLFLVLLMVDYKQSLDVWRQHLRPIFLVCAPLFVFLIALIINPPNGAVVRSHSFAMSILLAIGTMTGLLLMGWDAMRGRLPAYLFCMLILLLFPIVATVTQLFPWWHAINLDMGYSQNFSLPFAQPSQASFFVITCMWLLVGTLLSETVIVPSLIKGLAITYAIAITWFAVVLSGSRTGTGLFVILIILYVTLYALWWIFSPTARGLSLRSNSPAVILAGLLWGTILIVTTDQMSGIYRLMSITEHSWVDIISGKADPARQALWTRALPILQGTGFSVGADEPIEGFDAKAVIAMGGSLHSVLLDLYFWAGPFASMCFSTFLFALTGLAFWRVYSSWRGLLFPLYCGCLMVVLLILAYMYIQPVEYFAPIWVAIGVVLSLLLCQLPCASEKPLLGHGNQTLAEPCLV